MTTIVRSREMIRAHYEKVFGSKVPEYENLSGALSEKYFDLKSSIPRSRVLDLGYGNGKYTIDALRSGYNVDAVDLVDKSIFKSSVPKELLPNLNLIECDLSDFQFYDGHDITLCIDVLHFLPKSIARRLIKDVEKSTNKGGGTLFRVFSNIERKTKEGATLKFEDEAEFKTEELISFLYNTFQKWGDIRFTISKYSEHDQVKKHTYFRSDVLEFVAVNR
ncbi:class I SAM-dependent methyltransferase [Reinekea marinisedimentorum]|uniref:Tellurite resistance protein TehB n=1 Tax=Reinekea marinisedimentorum TaxID=230495 RepID=A0A4R3HU14_9GAMM|nr:class I SAM-dependent methyltransferase [Reinekea marinisedimentorum]TCS36697.1 tellurite resistance protein TehB [Reinekea marinisedimentorum]